MLSIIYTNAFKRSLKRCLRRGFDERLFLKVVQILSETGSLPDTYFPHKLKGDYKGCYECHIQPDWLLIWRVDGDRLLLVLVDTGTRADLFG